MHSMYHWQRNVIPFSSTRTLLERPVLLGFGVLNPKTWLPLSSPRWRSILIMAPSYLPRNTWKIDIVRRELGQTSMSGRTKASSCSSVSCGRLSFLGRASRMTSDSSSSAKNTRRPDVFFPASFFGDALTGVSLWRALLLVGVEDGVDLAEVFRVGVAGEDLGILAAILDNQPDEGSEWMKSCSKLPAFPSSLLSCLFFPPDASRFLIFRVATLLFRASLCCP